MSKSFLNQSGLPRGLRNNNPGNIRPGDSWQGMIGTSDGFVVFENIAWGIRAQATDVGNDMRIDGKTTLSALVAEYAPPSENNTGAYINSMVRFTGFGANQSIPHTQDALFKLIRGFIRVELGDGYYQLITDADVLEAFSLLNDGLKSYFGITAAGGSSSDGSGSAGGVLVGIAVLAMVVAGSTGFFK